MWLPIPRRSSLVLFLRPTSKPRVSCGIPGGVRGVLGCLGWIALRRLQADAVPQLIVASLVLDSRRPPIQISWTRRRRHWAQRSLRRRRNDALCARRLTFPLRYVPRVPRGTVARLVARPMSLRPGHRRIRKIGVKPPCPIQQRLVVVSNFGVGLSSSAAAALEALTTADNQLKLARRVGAV